MVRKAIVFIVLISTVIATSGCASKTIDELFRKKGIEHDLILHIEEISDGAITFYEFAFDNGQKGIGVALVQGSPEEGWEFVDNKGIGITESDLVWDVLKNAEKEIRLVYGVIQNPVIEKVLIKEVEDNQFNKKSFKDAIIIATKGYRLWFKLVSLDINSIEISGLSSEGDVQYTFPPSK